MHFFLAAVNRRWESVLAFMAFGGLVYGVVVLFTFVDVADLQKQVALGIAILALTVGLASFHLARLQAFATVPAKTPSLEATVPSCCVRRVGSRVELSGVFQLCDSADGVVRELKVMARVETNPHDIQWYSNPRTSVWQVLPTIEDSGGGFRYSLNALGAVPVPAGPKTVLDFGVIYEDIWRNQFRVWYRFGSKDTEFPSTTEQVLTLRAEMLTRTRANKRGARSADRETFVFGRDVIYYVRRD